VAFTYGKQQLPVRIRNSIQHMLHVSSILYWFSPRQHDQQLCRGPHHADESTSINVAGQRPCQSFLWCVRPLSISRVSVGIPSVRQSAGHTLILLRLNAISHQTSSNFFQLKS